MGLFYNNRVSGSGVAKGAKKKPFFRFWELFANKFWDFFKLNMIYVLFCLPVVTFGPATAALTSMMRNIYLERPQFVWHDFVKSFKENFKRSFFVGLLDIAVAAVGVITFIAYNRQTDPDAALKAAYVMSIVVQVLFFLMNFYIYPQIAALDLKLGDVFQNAMIMVFVNLPGELITLAAVAGIGALFVFFTLPAVFFLPFVPGAWLVFLSVFCCYPAIQKHIINPFYERSGEPNPEIPEWELEEDEEESVFEDRGGEEAPVLLKKEKKEKGGKVIR